MAMKKGIWDTILKVIIAVASAVLSPGVSADENVNINCKYRNTLNVMSLIGAIMLIGIVVKNGIVLIDYISLNRERGMGIREAVVTGGHSRLRPVIMTTLTTILGMVPMAIGTGQGSEMWRPMGTAVIGGLTVSTILTLILIPVLYCVFASVGVKRKRKKHHERLLQDVKINSNN